MPSALVVGGTGQTGPLIVCGLLDRGYDVTVLHSGRHEVPLPPIEHLHADVHFAEPIAEALSGRSFDLAMCMYGRSRLVAEELRGKVSRLIMVTGSGYAYQEPRRPDWGPFGVTVANELAPFAEDRELDAIGPLISMTERHVLQHQADGHYGVTILRYSNIFGPGAVSPLDWSIIRRILDRRPYFVVADGGLRLRSRSYRDNAAHAALLAIGAPEVATGQIYNVADDPPVITIGQWVQALADALGHAWEIIDVPIELVERLYVGQFGYHRLVDSSKIKAELGYADLVSPIDAVQQTAQWWSEHGATAAEGMTALTDRFDYSVEDQLVASYRSLTRQLLADAPKPAASIHPFLHPKFPGDPAGGSMVMEQRGADAAASRRTYPYAISAVSA